MRVIVQPRLVAMAWISCVGVTRGLMSRITGRESPMRSISARDSVVFPDPTSPVNSASSFSSTAYSSRASASLCCALSYRNAGSGVFPNGLVVKPKCSSNIGGRSRLSRFAAETVDQRCSVNHEHDVGFADFRRAGDAGHALESLADRLDHDLLLTHER